MAATIEWRVEVLDCYPTKDSKTDVVMTVHWRCNGSEEKDSETYSATNYGTVAVTYKDGDPFTPFADLTKDQVLGWIWADDLGVDDDGNKIEDPGKIEKDVIEASIQAQIDNEVNPPIIQPELPWD